MNVFKRMLACLLSLALLLSVTPFAVFAVTQEEAMSAPVLLCGEEWVIDAAENDGEQTFVFVPEEDGRYVFYSYDTDFDVYAYLYDNEFDYIADDDDGGDGLNFRLAFDLTAGETYYYVVRLYGGSDNGTYCVKLAVEAEADGLTITEGDAVSRYMFTESCFHAQLTPDGAIPEEITWESSDESIATINSYGWTNFYKKGSVTLTATSENGHTDSIVVTVTDGEPMDYGSAVQGTLSCEEAILYKFTVPNDGEYSIIVNGEGVKSTMIYDDDGDYCYGNSGEQYQDCWVYLGAGYEYYLAVSNREDNREAYYSVYITPTVPAESVSIYPQHIEGTEMSEKEVGVDFEPVGAATEWVEWQTTDRAVAYAHDNMLYLGHAGEAELTAKTDSGLTDTVTVRVLPAVVLQAGQQVSTTLKTEEYTVFSLTVAEEGYYQFEASSDYYHQVQMLTEDRAVVVAYSGENFNFGTDLQPGTYYVRVTNWDDRAQENGHPFTLAMDMLPYAEDMQIAIYQGADDSSEIIDAIAVDENSSFNLTTVFSPEESVHEEVTWESSDESVATVDYWGYVFLVSPGTAVITATSERGLTDSVTVTADPLDELSLTTATNGTVAPEEVLTFKFIPEKDGTYAFCEYGDWYKYIYVTDRYGNHLNGETGHYVECSAALTAGETYYVYFKSHCGEDVDYELTVMELVPAESITIEGGYDTVMVGKSFTVSAVLAPENAIPETITWESSDESVATVDYWGCVYTHSAGTVTITARSERGLTGSITVTVKDVPTLPLGETVSGTLEDGEQVSYRFTVEEDCWCVFESTSDFQQHFVVRDKEGRNYVSWVTTAVSASVLLKSGKTYYLDLRTDYFYDDSVGDYTLSTTLVPTEQIPLVTPEQPASSTLQYGERVFYRFVSEEAAVYRVRFNGNGWYHSYYIYNDEGYTYTSSGSYDGDVDLHTEAGRVYYFEVRMSEEDAVGEHTVSLERLVPAESITIVGGDTEGFVGDEIHLLAEYTPENAIHEWCRWTSDDESIASFDHDSPWLILHKVGTAVITVTSENGLTDSITVTVKEPIELENGVEVNGTLAYKQDMVYQFTLEEDSWCSFYGVSSDENGENMSHLLWVENENGYSNGSWCGWRINPRWLFEGGKTYTVHIRHAEYEQREKPIYYGLTFFADPLSTMATLGETVEGTLSQKDYAIYRIMPEKDGMYELRFEAVDANHNTDMELYDAYGNSWNDRWMSGTIEMTCKADEPWYVVVQKRDPHTVEYRLDVVELVPAESVLIAGELTEGFVGEWLYFETQFAPENSIREQVVWASDDESVATVDEWGSVHLVGAGTATITVTSENGLAGSITVTAKAATPITLDGWVQGTLASRDKVAYSFTAPADGHYRFNYGGSYKQNILCNQQGETLAQNWASEGAFEIVAAEGETYYFYFIGSAENIAEYTLTVISLVPATEMVFADGDYVGYPNGYYYPVVQFFPENAVSEPIRFESSDTSVVSVTPWGELRLLSVGTATITATSESGLTDSITVTVKDYQEMLLDTEYVFNNENGNVETAFKFTPTKDGIYSFSSYGEETDPYVKLYDKNWNQLESADDNADRNNFRLQYGMTAGELYYLVVGAYQNGVGTYYVKAEKLKSAESMSIPFNRTVVTQNDRFHFSVEFGPEGCAYESVTWHGDNDRVAIVEQWGEVLFVGGGTVTLTATSESGLTASLTLTVVGAQTILLGQEAVGTISPLSACVLKWTVPEDGAYRVNFGGDHKNNEIRAAGGRYIDNSWAEEWAYHGEFKAGEVYYFHMQNTQNSEIAYAFSIDRLCPATSLTIDQGEVIQGCEGDETSLSVTFGPENAMPEELTYISGNAAVATVDEYGTIRFVGEGVTVITVVSASGLRDEITVRVKAAAALQLNVTVEGEMTSAYVQDLYSFTPTETDRYTFHIRSGFYKLYEICSAEGYDIVSGSGYGSMIPSLLLEAGQTYYLRLKNYDEYGDYTVCVNKTIAATEMTIDQGDAVTGLVSETLYPSVTFGPEGAQNEEVNWTSSDPSVAYVSPWGTISLLAEGTAVLTATSESGLTDSITVTVEQPPALTLNRTVNGTFQGEDNPAYRFVPTVSGYYSFIMQKEPYAEMVVADANFDIIVGGGNSDKLTVQAYLMAGETYYVRMYQYNPQAIFDYTLTVTDTVPATSMSIKEGDMYTSFPGMGHRFGVIFSPDNALHEEVTWTSSDPEIVEVYEDGYAEFYQTGTVTLTAKTQSGFTDSICVQIFSLAEVAKPLPSNEVEVSTEENVTVYSFTPTESGRYLFASAMIDGSVDPMLILYDANEEELARGDDETEDMQFRFEYTLTAGETYYLFMRLYEMQEEGEHFLLTVQRAMSLSSITISEGDIQGDINDEYQLSVEFAPAAAVPEGFTFTSANPLVAAVSNDGWLWLRSAGTTTVTVTSESGLTDTITVTVNGVAEHVYDHACDTDCNICGEVREVPHAYSSICDADCNLCGALRAVAAAHTYDNTCDTACNLCGAVREIRHTYSGDCDPLCDVCGAPQTHATAHTYDNACDTECNVCGAVRETVHAYSGDCDNSCNVCGDLRKPLASHTHDNACDTSCNVCGELREASHTYAGACDSVCDVCGDVREVTAEHTYDGDADTVCNVCGAERDAVHQYSGVCDTTCNLCGEEREVTAEHTYDNACDTNCNVCGAVRMTEHAYSAVCDTVCDNCGFVRTDAAAHGYDNACDTDCNVCGEIRETVHAYAAPCDRFCDVCGDERTPVANHSRDNLCQANCTLCGESLEVTHAYDGSCDASCNRCGALRDAAAHTYDNICDTDCNVCGAVRTVEHMYTGVCDELCNVCGAIRTAQPHDYDNACDANCNVCGASRTPSDHVYDNDRDADCNVCGAVREVVTRMLGDVDGNNRVDSTDARLTLQYAVQKITGDQLDLDAADVDGNGRVDSTDARLILQYAVKKISQFPAA